MMAVATAEARVAAWVAAKVEARALELGMAWDAAKAVA
jgi:hypothetical protein